MCRVRALLLVFAATLRGAAAMISGGAVLLKPCGVLEMQASWVDSPQHGALYNIYLLTTIQSTGAVTLHKQNGFRFNTTAQSYRMTDATKTLFVAGNSQTVGTFPGFKLNNQYRVYINYYNAAGAMLNQAGGQTEMSLYASPMVQASAPLNVKTCAVLDASSSPCSSVPMMPFSVRVSWDRPTSFGYDTFFPTNYYGIEGYQVQVSASADFSTLAGSVVCMLGQVDAACYFDRRVAALTGLERARAYYHRIAAFTIIGTGVFSAAGVAPVTVGGPGAPLALKLAATDVSAFVCVNASNASDAAAASNASAAAAAANCSVTKNYTYAFTWQAPTDTGDGTSSMALVSYYVQASSDDFGSLAESASLTSTYPGGLVATMRWNTARWYAAGVRVAFRVRASNSFEALGATGAWSDVLENLGNVGCPDNARWNNASHSCLCLEGYQDLDGM